MMGVLRSCVGGCLSMATAGVVGLVLLMLLANGGS